MQKATGAALCSSPSIRRAGERCKYGLLRWCCPDSLCTRTNKEALDRGLLLPCTYRFHVRTSCAPGSDDAFVRLYTPDLQIEIQISGLGPALSPVHKAAHSSVYPASSIRCCFVCNDDDFLWSQRVLPFIPDRCLSLQKPSGFSTPTALSSDFLRPDPAKPRSEHARLPGLWSVPALPVLHLFVQEGNWCAAASEDARQRLNRSHICLDFSCISGTPQSPARLPKLLVSFLSICYNQKQLSTGWAEREDHHA